MTFINYAAREINCKIVYYGPGLCGKTTNIQFITLQLLAPIGTPLTHFLAPSNYTSWGPFSLPPITLDAICFDFTGGLFGPVSPVVRITVQ